MLLNCFMVKDNNFRRSVATLNPRKYNATLGATFVQKCDANKNGVVSPVDFLDTQKACGAPISADNVDSRCLCDCEVVERFWTAILFPYAMGNCAIL